MKLLFDHNLSPRLVDRLTDLFPGSTHLYTLGMDREEDRQVWIYAQSNDFTIVTRDGDYNELLVLRGFPPKIVWIRRGNCSTAVIEEILRSHIEDIQALATEPTLGILTLY
jgi:predicted nuclease of predicted toxin-antitoxin system